MAEDVSGKESLSARLARLRQRQVGSFEEGIPAAEPLPAEAPPGCLAYPASSAQVGLWLLHQLEPDLTAYHLPLLWRLRGDLDRAALEEALRDLIERHASLRTSFRLEGSVVQQIIHPSTPVPLVAEWLGDRHPDAVIAQWLEQEGRTPFDLSAGLLLRARLLTRQGQQQHWLLLNHHHIASDGWSFSVLARDLTALYNARCAGRTPDLPQLRVRYQDYATWQRRRLSQARQQQLRQDWARDLTDLEPLQLPTDRPRPATPSHRGGRLSWRIDAALLGPFEQLCRREGATLQMGLLALVTLVLHRYSHQLELAIGVPFWGRSHPDLEPLIGCFINTLPIRPRVDPQQSFRRLLLQVRERSLAAYDHQDLPFEQIVEALNLPRDPSRNPLVQVMLQLIELPEASLQGMHGLQVGPPELIRPSALVDLSFYFHRSHDQGLQGEIVYATDLFEAGRISRLRDHLLTLIAAVLEAPEAPIAALSLLPEAERRLLAAWQRGPTIDVPDLCVHQLFEQQVERTPDATALICQERQLSYSELNDRADRLAAQLIVRGVGPERIVAVGLERSAELIVALLAVLKAGGAFLVLPLQQPQARLRGMLQDAQARLILSGGAFLEPAGRLASPDLTLLDLTSLENSTKAACQQRPSPTVCSANLAYVLYTSGSTGRPKGVAVEHRSIARRCQFYPQLWGLNEHARVLAQSEMNFDMATREWLLPLTCGATVVLATREQQQEPRLFQAVMAQHRCTHVAATPSKFEIVTAEAPLEGVIVTAGGERFSADLARKLVSRSVRRVVHSYGPSEVSIACTMHDPSDLDLQATSIPLGRPLPDTTLLVLDRQLCPCPIGVPGELHIGGGGLARGYLHNPALTAEKFIPDPFSSDSSARLYKSGDLASWNPDGTLAFHGRIDHQIKLRGHRIEPGEIEFHLLSHPAVAQAAVVLHHDESGSPLLVAYWIAKAASSGVEGGSVASVIEVGELHSFLAGQLPGYMVPSAFVELPAMPLTNNGKLDRSRLPVPSLAAADHERRILPRDALECHLHRLWVEVLCQDQFGVMDSFFLIGGDSLKAARLTSRIQRFLDDIVYVSSIFEAPTIAAYADFLRRDYARSLPDDFQTGGALDSRLSPGISEAEIARVREQIDSPCPSSSRPIRPKNPKAIFILSAPRSGSTLMRVMLAGHPRLFAPPELYLMMFDTLGQRRRSFAGASAYLLEGVLRALVEIHGQPLEEARRWMSRLEDQDCSVQDFYLQLQGMIGDRILVDKTPAYAVNRHTLDCMEACFDEPFYVHLVRHPGGMIYSFERVRLEQIWRPRIFKDVEWSRAQYDARQLAELIWIILNENISSFLAPLPRHRQIRLHFEVLVTQPEQAMRALCERAGLTYSAELLNPYDGSRARMVDGLHQQSRMLGDPRFHAHGQIDASVAGHWKSRDQSPSLSVPALRIARALGCLDGAPAASPSPQRLIARATPISLDSADA